MADARSGSFHDGASQSRSRRLTDRVRTQHGSERDTSLTPTQSTPGDHGRSISEQRNGSPDGSQASPQGMDVRNAAHEEVTNRYPADQRAQIAQMDQPELAQYLEDVGCEIDTIQAIVAAKLTGTRYLAVLDHAEADEILKNELVVASRITRITMISDAQKKKEPNSLERESREEARDLHRIKWSPVPRMPATRTGETMMSGKQWKNYGLALTGWCDMSRLRGEKGHSEHPGT